MSKPPEADEQTATPDISATPPVLRIVTPGTTPEEVAAIVAVLSAVGGGDAPAKRPAPAWSAPHRAVRRALPQGRGGWRASGLPR